MKSILRTDFSEVKSSFGKIIKQIVSSINIGRSQTIAIRGNDIDENGILLVLFVFGGG